VRRNTFNDELQTTNFKKDERAPIRSRIPLPFVVLSFVLFEVWSCSLEFRACPNPNTLNPV